MTYSITARAAPPSVPMSGGHRTGVKEIRVRATATGFEPPIPSIPAHTKVMMIIDVKQAPACAKAMTVDPLKISGKADHHDQVELTIPPQETDARLTLRCSMGMLKTTIRVSR